MKSVWRSIHDKKKIWWRRQHATSRRTLRKSQLHFVCLRIEYARASAYTNKQSATLPEANELIVSFHFSLSLRFYFTSQTFALINEPKQSGAISLSRSLFLFAWILNVLIGDRFDWQCVARQSNLSPLIDFGCTKMPSAESHDIYKIDYFAPDQTNSESIWFWQSSTTSHCMQL